jgi:hypothetical protein
MHKAELEAAIQRTWAALHAALQRLTDEQMTQLRDAQGWTVKDHLYHLASWERTVVYLLQNRPRHEAMGIDAALFQAGPVDAINAAVYQQGKNLSLGEVRTQFQEVHWHLLELLGLLSDAELQRPLRSYLPDEPGEGDGPPAIQVIQNNSCDHYVEHQGWIEALVTQAA